MVEGSKGDNWQSERLRGFLTGDWSNLPEGFLRETFLEKLFSRIFNVLPSDPRCIDCNAPFAGIGGSFTRIIGFDRSNLTPKLCNHCDRWMKKHEVGVEIDLTMLFADVRGSTSLAESMGIIEFRNLINRFYKATTDVLVESYAVIDKLIGDEVAAGYVPGLAGPDYTARAVEAAQELLRSTGHADPEGPWVPVGVGVHSGLAYIGTVGSPEGMTDITVLGDAANTASRLASQAGPGEVIVSEEAASLANLEVGTLERRVLELKGKTEPVTVSVLRVAPTG